MFDDRRHQPRRPHHFGVRVLHGDRSYGATTTDVSASGAFIATRNTAAKGASVTVLARRAPGGPVVGIVGEVMRGSDAFGSAQLGFAVRWVSAHGGRDCGPLRWFLGTLLQRHDVEVIVQEGGAAHAASLDGSTPGVLQLDTSAGHEPGAFRANNGRRPSDAIVQAPLPRRGSDEGSKKVSGRIAQQPSPELPEPPLGQQDSRELQAEMELQDAFASVAPPPVPVRRPVRAPAPEPTPDPVPVPEVTPANIAAASSAAPITSAAAQTPSAPPPAPLMKRALMSMTGRLFGKEEPVITGAMATSSDGWFYRPDGDGPISARADADGQVVQQLRTGRARADSSGFVRQTPVHDEKVQSPPPSPSARVQPERHSSTALHSEAGEPHPLHLPCSYILSCDFIGASVVAASRHGLTVQVSTEQLPRENQTVEINVPVYSDGRYHSVSVQGPVINEPRLNDDAWEFTVRIADVTGFGLASAWLTFLREEFNQPELNRTTPNSESKGATPGTPQDPTHHSPSNS